MMKFKLIIAAMCLALAGCCCNEKSAPALDLMKAENFQAEVDGKQVDLYTLTTGDLTMQVRCESYRCRQVYIEWR